MPLCYLDRSCGSWLAKDGARHRDSRPSGAFRRSILDNRIIIIVSATLVIVSEQKSDILVKATSNTQTGKGWSCMESPIEAFSPAQSQRRCWIVQRCDEPQDLFTWLRERYIARKSSVACCALSAGMAESSDNDTRTARSCSADQGVADPVFPRESIFLVTTPASLGTVTPSVGWIVFPGRSS